MPLVKDYLWSNILWSSANGKGPALVEELCESKVRQLKIAIVGNEQVFRFKVSEYNILAVKVLETAGHCGPVEPGLICGEWLNRPQICEELATIDQL